jgi:Phage integrase, N-terminal SAM-like domain
VQIGQADNPELRAFLESLLPGPDSALEELLGPASTASAGVLVREWLNTWLDTRIIVRPSTLRSYQAICANHLIPYLGRSRWRR